MAAGGGRARRWVKVAVPLLGLVIIASVFLIARPRPPIEHEVAEPLSGSSVLQPRFVGRIDERTRLEVTAREIVEKGGPGSLALDTPRLVIRSDPHPDAPLSIESREGVLETRPMRGSFTGRVRLETPDLVVEAPQLTFALVGTGRRTIRLDAEGGVTARSSAGRIVAESAEVVHDPDHPERTRALFNRNVRLLYNPGKADPSEAASE